MSKRFYPEREYPPRALGEQAIPEPEELPPAVNVAGMPAAENQPQIAIVDVPEPENQPEVVIVDMPEPEIPQAEAVGILIGPQANPAGRDPPNGRPYRFGDENIPNPPDNNPSEWRSQLQAALVFCVGASLLVGTVVLLYKLNDYLKKPKSD